jgi:TonB-linked SusC/RagA family outer membrane protein
VGYIPQEITVGDQAVINAILDESISSIDEVVVVGYGSQRKVTLTGAVAAIGSSDIVVTKHSNLQNALTGKIAGVKVIQRSSEPGIYNNEFSIRGMGTPLIIIDGVPRDNMVRLDENEVESVSILKDASAAVYGTRAANGVVLITTKKGTGNRKFQLDYNGMFGGQKILYTTEMVDAIGYMQLRNERSVNGGGAMEYTQADFDPYLNGTKQSTDWWHPFVKEFPMQMQHNVSAVGGTEKIDYFVNFGYYSQDGLWKEDNTSYYNRYNLRSNVTAQLAKGLKAEVMLNLMLDTRMQQPEDTWRIFRQSWRESPLYPVYVDDDPNYPTGSVPFLMSVEKGGYNKYNQRLAQTNMALEWDIPGVTGLKARAMYSYDYKEDEGKTFRKPYVTYDLNRNPSVNGWIPLKREYSGYTNTMLQVSLNYAKTINENHNISAQALYEESDREGDNFSATRNVELDAVDQLFSGNSSSQTNGQEKGSRTDPRLFHYANKGLVGRLAYDYASKYLAEFSFRYDGSSFFGEGQQWGLFPVGSVGWRLSEESFIKGNPSLSFIDNAKIRASYGKMGDDGNSTYQFLTGYDYPSGAADAYFRGYVVGGKFTNAVGVRGVSNRMLTWIESTTADIGLDADLWKGLLGISLDFFQRDRKGLMSTRLIDLPTEIGVGLPQENLNSDQTRGFEITLTHRNKIGKDFTYYASGNMAFDRTKDKYVEITQFGSERENWLYNANNRWQNISWGYDYLGQYQSFDEIWNSGLIYSNGQQGNTMMLPGDPIFGDWNGDGIIDGNDTHPLQTGAPRKPMITYGFSLGAEYKGIDLNMVFSGTALNKLRYDAWRLYPEGPFGEDGGGNGSSFTEFLDRWHRADEMNPSNDQEWIPGKYSSTNIANNRDFVRSNSDFWIRNVAFLRLKSLELGYTVPSKLTGKVGISRARFYVNAYNLFTITATDLLFDPEFQENDPMAFPLSQTYNAGVSISF